LVRWYVKVKRKDLKKQLSQKIKEGKKSEISSDGVYMLGEGMASHGDDQNRLQPESAVAIKSPRISLTF